MLVSTLAVVVVALAFCFVVVQSSICLLPTKLLAFIIRK